MKHATQPSLDRLEPLLARLRRQAPLKEKKRGAFYLRAKAEQATLLRTVAQLLADQERSADIASSR